LHDDQVFRKETPMKKQFRRWPAVLLTLAMLSLSTAPTLAGGDEPFDPIDAQKLIDACWAISKEKRDSGVTGKMREGSAITAGCFHQVIIEQAEAIFEPEYLEKVQIEKRLDQLADAYQGIYWSLYNEHRGCGISCGTMYHVFHLGAYTGLLQKMIRDMVSQRNKYRL
jgi:hypothetical protein